MQSILKECTKCPSCKKYTNIYKRAVCGKRIKWKKAYLMVMESKMTIVMFTLRFLGRSRSQRLYC